MENLTDNEKAEIFERLKSAEKNLYALCVILADERSDVTGQQTHSGLRELMKLMEAGSRND